MKNFNMYVPVEIKRLYFNGYKFIEVKEFDGFIYVKPLMWPIGNNTKVLTKHTNCRSVSFGMSSDLIKNYQRYDIEVCENNWLKLVETKTKDTYESINAYLTYDDTVKSKKVNVSKAAERDCFWSPSHIERIIIDNKEEYCLRHDKINENTNKIVRKSTGLVFSIKSGKLQKGKYYVVSEIKGFLKFKQVSKKFIKENKNVPYVSISR